MSFFKLEDTILQEAPNFVHTADYELSAEHKHLYKYPIFDWYWFDTIEEAKIFFDIKEPVDV